MFQHILVPLDGSRRAEQAIPIAARIAHASKGSSIILIRVVEAVMNYAWQFAQSPIDYGEAFNAEYYAATTYIKEIVHSDTLQGLNVTTKVIEGHAARAIMTTAQAEEIDLIVMSSHGYTGLKRWVLGSVSQQIERHSTIPTLILRDNPVANERLLQGNKQPMRIMVALDGTPVAESILPAAATLCTALSAPAKGSLHLAMVLPQNETATVTTVEDYSRAIKEAQAYLHAVIQCLHSDEQPGRKLDITSSVSLQSNVSEALVKLAEMGASMEGVSTFTGCDMIAMATRGRASVERWIHPSVTEHVFDVSPVPFLVLRVPRRESAWDDEPLLDENDPRVYAAGGSFPGWVGLL
ncbi:MAG TPA: universal stress protein [Ktedonobacteraceae bacterium]